MEHQIPNINPCTWLSRLINWFIKSKRFLFWWSLVAWKKLKNCTKHYFPWILTIIGTSIDTLNLKIESSIYLVELIWLKKNQFSYQFLLIACLVMCNEITLFSKYICFKLHFFWGKAFTNYLIFEKLKIRFYQTGPMVGWALKVAHYVGCCF